MFRYNTIYTGRDRETARQIADRHIGAWSNAIICIIYAMEDLGLQNLFRYTGAAWDRLLNGFLF